MKTSTLTFGLLSAFLAAPTLATINKGKAYYDSGNVDTALWIVQRRRLQAPEWFPILFEELWKKRLPCH
jgi:hypothetical protein